VNTVDDIVHVDIPRASYTHSFGLAHGSNGFDTAVVVAQPIYSNMVKMMEFATMDKAFETPAGSNTTVHVMPMDGSAPLSVDLPPFFFGHFLNSWHSGEKEVSFDLDRQETIFFDRFSMAVQTNKTARDEWAAVHQNAYSTPTRYTVDLTTGDVKETTLFPKLSQCLSKTWCEMDLFKLHPDDIGKEYCGFWAWHNYWNSTSFGSWAIVRAELCGDEPKIVASWYQKNVFPSEATFVPAPGATDKTEGVMIFKVFEGETGVSKLVVADAKTLKTLATAVLPVGVPFTIHGDFMPAGGDEPVLV